MIGWHSCPRHKQGAAPDQRTRGTLAARRFIYSINHDVLGARFDHQSLGNFIFAWRLSSLGTFDGLAAFMPS